MAYLFNSWLLITCRLSVCGYKAVTKTRVLHVNNDMFHKRSFCKLELLHYSFLQRPEEIRLCPPVSSPSEPCLISSACVKDLASCLRINSWMVNKLSVNSRGLNSWVLLINPLQLPTSLGPADVSEGVFVRWRPRSKCAVFWSRKRGGEGRRASN